MTSDMRGIIDRLAPASTETKDEVLEEGIIDSIRNWISSLSNPVKKKGLENLRDLESRLRTKYGSQVPQQVKSANKDWIWSKATYRDLYNFASQVLGADQASIEAALKNKIVVNNLKLVVRQLPDGVDPPTLPLTSRNMQNNTSVISPTIDPQTKQYLSKAITIAILDGLAYIEQQKADAQQAATRPASTAPTAAPATAAPATPAGSAPAVPGMPSSPDDIKAAIAAIRAGLSAMKGSTT